MYSILPALVSALFLGYGLYVVAERGLSRISGSFLALCITTVFWQGTWAVLFQVRDPVVAELLVRIGYLFIVFLPTCLYLFLAELSESRADRKYAIGSFAVAAVLAGFALTTDLFVDGYYRYFFGPYPRAGVLHPVHVLQTVIVVSRGLYITFRAQQVAFGAQRARLRLVIASLFVYFLAAVDYLVNYGLGFYPPGVVFVAVSLGIIAIAVTKYELMSPATVAASVAHEMRTPLASIRMQADALAEVLPEWKRGYELAVAHGLLPRAGSPAEASRLAALPEAILHQVDRSNAVIDMMLASARMEEIDTSTFARQRASACVQEALDTYPFGAGERELVQLLVQRDFEFHGSASLLVFVLFNLLKNSLHAVKAAGKGGIEIVLDRRGASGVLRFTDTASGIAPDVLPRIFETYYTTKAKSGAGIGLPFCRRVATTFGGTLTCDTRLGEYTTFTFTVPAL